MNANDEKKLKDCLNPIIKMVHTTLTQFKSKHETSSEASASAERPASQRPLPTTTTTINRTTNDPLFENSVQNTNVNSFTVDMDEEDLLNTLTTDIQNHLKTHLPNLSKICANYLEQFLHEYHFDKDRRVFTEGLTANILYTFHQNLNGLLMAVQAYAAAYNGNLPIVKKFLQLYSHYKDKSGFWGTTLLWSAARRDHMHIVKYLIESVGCSVNAQNQVEINYALIGDDDAARFSTSSLGYNPVPKLGSTALHAACCIGRLEIVKYLISKGADYFLTNQSGETPIHDSQEYSSVCKFFKEYLVWTYINNRDASPPYKPILECHDREPNNCVWEYKPVKELEWQEFTMTEHHALSTALKAPAPGQPFEPTVYLPAGQGTYTIQLLTFLRSGKNQDPNPSSRDSQAWIRCRGSSIGNFDIHCLWQLMLVKHPTNEECNKSAPPSLESVTIPSVYDSKFQLKLLTWYTLDSKSNDILDETMNYRRRCVDIDCQYVRNITCNLYAFTFANADKTILGFLRWIPKYIANSPNQQDVIKELDNFSAISQFQPIPLTTKQLEASMRAKSTTVGNSTIIETNEEDDADMTDNLAIAETAANDDDGHIELTSTFGSSGTWSLQDISTNEFQDTPDDSEDETPLPTSIADELLNVHDHVEIQTSRSINPVEQVAVNNVSEVINRSEQDQAARQARKTLETENDDLEKRLSALERQLSEQLRESTTHNTEHQNILHSTIGALDQLQQQLSEKTQHEQLINDTAKRIAIVEYTLPKSNQSVIWKLNLILKVLKAVDYPQKEYFKDSVPMIDLHDRQECTLVLKGFPQHHEQLKKIFDRLDDLFQRAQTAERYYEQQINLKIQLLIKVINRVRPSHPLHWKHYRGFLINTIQDKSQEYVRRFKDYINDQLKLLLNGYIEESSAQDRPDIGNLTNEYMQTITLVQDIELLKAKALDEFIRDQVLLQQKSIKCVPSKESITTLNKCIAKTKALLTTNADYKGCELKHFRMIMPLLQRIMIYYHCFLLQLPLFEASIDLLNKIDSHTVITIETATGSGKSTLLPALLVAEGYDKILVTQPRRLPCTLISQRVNSMVNDQISGWAVSGAEQNVQAKILYITDGLLKERLLNDENLITKNTTLNKSVVFFIDEVHERSVNIDLCLASFARLLTLNPDLKTKMKVIISSATLDTSVPTLFKKIPHCSVSQFNLTALSTLYPVTKPIEDPVTKKRVSDENIIDLVQKLYSKRVRNQQILCFVNSTQEVHANCGLLKNITKGAIVAYPLVQSQSSRDQEEYIDKGTVFFSTTVAETSLTFPCLKYVIDTGVINMPKYNLQLERTELEETKAAESTTKQRLGRLGRTQPGEYYALYEYKSGEQRKYPVPQICQCELTTIEFALRRSRLRTNLKEFKQYLPNKPDQEYIDDATRQLHRLGLISSSTSDAFTNLGASIAQLPDFGSLPMSKAVYAALKEYHCGRDLIILSSLLSVLNTSAIFKAIPAQYKSPEGDFMTLLNAMNAIILVRDSVPPEQFRLDRVCNAKGLSGATHVMKQALRRYENLERAFNLSDEFRESAQIQSGSWKNIARALLAGYSDKVFVSLKILQGKTQQFLKYNIPQRGSSANPPPTDETPTIAVIDRSSTLRTSNKGLLPASLVLARDVRYLTVVRSTAVLSFVGKIELDWLEYIFTRTIKLNATEEQKLRADILQKAIHKFVHVKIRVANSTVEIRGPSGYVLNAELFIRQQLVTVLPFTLQSNEPNNPNNNLTRNLKSVTKIPIDLFGPLRWRWDAEQQVKIRTKMNATQGTIDVTVEGLDSQNHAVKNEFDSFLRWLRSCAVIRGPHSGVAPRVLKPQIRDAFLDMETKIGRITDPDRSSVDIWKSLKGPEATRETRMEVVAWIAVCKFNCRLEGGFVRDWVVGNYSAKPASLPPQQWVHFDQATHLPVLELNLVPADLDCHLPALKYFDVEAFIDALYDYKITARAFRQDWRYVLLIDEHYTTGPFTMDLIEPHIALTHDRIDFDVSNLSLEQRYTKDLGMRVDITRGSHPIQLEAIVENIRKKHFQVLRPIDGENGPNTSGTVAERIAKMQTRGWTQIGQPLPHIPDPPSTYNAILVPYPASTVLYQNLVTAMEKIPGARVLSIEQIKNPDIESLYENMKKTISKECQGNNPNERELFHGTSDVASEGIINGGYDDRYFAQSGAWGRGAYFADDPRKSNGYAPADPRTQRRVIFYNKVLLGIESVQNTTNNTLGAAPPDHHSVHGTAFHYHEYIVYRYGQALPYLKITYTAPV